MPAGSSNSAESINHGLCAANLPITSLEQLEKFESLLEDESFKTNIKIELIRQHGSDVGMGSGAGQVAFDLNDKMFSPHLLQRCSWTGQAFDKNFPDGKIGFNRFQRAINLFWEVVNTADKSYDMNTNKVFLQKRMFSSKKKIEVMDQETNSFKFKETSQELKI